jgi:hypothetical protein
MNHLLTFGWHFTTVDNANSKSFVFDQSTLGRPTYFAHLSDPLVKITSCSGRCQDSSGASIVGTSFHIPQGAKSGSNTDSHITVIETDTGDEYGFWRTSLNWTTKTMTAANGDKINTATGTGIQLHVGADAGHFALSGGLIRPNELLDATNNHTYINHALALNVPCVASGGTSGIPSSVFPALTASGGTIGSDGCVDSSKGDGTPYGSLLMLNMSDTSIQTGGYPLWQQTIMKTLSHYGAYVTDTHGSDDVSFFTQSCPSWTSLGATDMLQSVMQTLGTPSSTYYFTRSCTGLAAGAEADYGLKSSIPIPVNKLQVLDPCVPRGTC